MPTEKPRYSITLDEELLKEIEDFRFKNRYSSKNQATVDLIRAGLNVLMKNVSNDNEQNAIECNTKLSEEETQILNKYNALDQRDKEHVDFLLNRTAPASPSSFADMEIAEELTSPDTKIELVKSKSHD